jgi:hypothetical protein
MSAPQPARAAKLVVGILLSDRGLLREVAARLEAEFGDADMVSAWMPFDFTDYYAAEMGAPLFRRLFAFERLIAQERLPEIKLMTNRLEQAFARQGRRRANIDPGYLLLERFVLATGKNYSHRIHLGSGIYADLTLVYGAGDYRPLPWTYPDYAGAPLRGFLQQVRRRYAVQLKPGAPAPGRAPAAGGR